MVNGDLEGKDRRPSKPVKASPGLTYFWVCFWVVVISLLYIEIEPEAISEPVDEYSYALFDRLFGQEIYSAPHSDDIGIVLFNQSALDDLGATWPVVYGLHARVLSSLLDENPLAVFLDFTLRDRRAPPLNAVGDEPIKYPLIHVRDGSLGRLVRVLKRYKEKGIPVYVPAAEMRKADQSAILAELAPYVTLVAGWGDARKQADLRGISYSLHPQKPGRDDPAFVAQDRLMSPAFQIYVDLCRRKFDAVHQNAKLREKFEDASWACNPGYFTNKQEQDGYGLIRDEIRQRPMALIWPKKQPDYKKYVEGKPQNGEGQKPFNCLNVDKRGEQTAWSTIRHLLVNLFYFIGPIDRPTANCGPFDRLTAAQIVLGAPGKGKPWKSNFANRIVFYGMDLQGFQDVVDPPTVDNSIAAVSEHAMALENLLTFGDGYLSEKAYHWTFVDIDWVEFLTLLVVMIWRGAVIYCVRRNWPRVISKSEEFVETYGGHRVLSYVGWKALSLFSGIQYVASYLCGKISRHAFRVNREILQNRTEADVTEGKKPGGLVVDPDKDSDHLRTIFIFLLLAVDFLVVLGIVFSSIYWVQFSFLRLAPANWLAILTIGLVTYAPYLDALFSNIENEDQTSKVVRSRQSQSASKIPVSSDRE